MLQMKLFFKSLDVRPQPLGHSFFSLPELVGPVQDAPALAEVFLQGLDLVLEK